MMNHTMQNDVSEARNARLSDFTTFKLGGPCRRLISCATPSSLTAVIQERIAAGEPYILMGGGSNLLVSDSGCDAVIVRYVSDTPLITCKESLLTVSGSTVLDHLAAYTVDHALDGLICCSGIPGTVGGAIVGNAGAFGEQIGDALESVLLLDVEGHTKEVAAGDLAFRYRGSRLQRSGEVVLQATFNLEKSDRDKMRTRRDEILKLRAEKHPDLSVDPCIGSIFRNIEPTSKAGRRQAAGWFLEQAGAKGMRIGGAVIYEKHANIIVKREGCTAQNVHDLIDDMQAAVKDKFDLDLVREVRYLGSFKGEPDAPTHGFY